MTLLTIVKEDKICSKWIFCQVLKNFLSEPRTTGVRVPALLWLKAKAIFFPSQMYSARDCIETLISLKPSEDNRYNKAIRSSFITKP